VIQAPRAEAAIDRGQSRPAATIASRLEPFLPAEQVVSQQRYESHRHDAAAHQRGDNHHRQRVDEVAHAAFHQQQRQKGDAIRDRRVEDGAGQFLRAEPRRNLARASCRNFAIDGVAGHHRIIDQQPQRDNHRRDRDLLQIDAQDLADSQRHGDGQRNG
jgi:anti-sigma28 factor (negative regulator of flagellin synthesis)